jgi:Ca2+-binding RTX toxin-like protein
VLVGGVGNDFIAERLSAAEERVDGGPGDDYIFTTGGTDRVILGGEGNDVVRGGRQIPAREGADQFGDGRSDGGPGNDIVLGGGADDFVFGGDGDDALYGGARLDAYDCGAGNDVAYVENALEAAYATAHGCERVVTGDPSVGDPRFDGLNGASHPGKTTGGSAGAQLLEEVAAG